MMLRLSLAEWYTTDSLHIGVAELVPRCRFFVCADLNAFAGIAATQEIGENKFWNLLDRCRCHLFGSPFAYSKNIPTKRCFRTGKENLMIQVVNKKAKIT